MSKSRYLEEDESLETLLTLDKEIFPMADGYWTKFEAYRVTPDQQIPHGIRYSLTLHDRNNTRILGFDNAHSVKTKKKKYGAQKITWDHKHRKRTVHPYEFESASQLLEDFWGEVSLMISGKDKIYE